MKPNYSAPNISFFVLLAALLLQVNTALAQDLYPQILPLNPRIIGDLSTNRIGIADGDLLLPLYGNNSQILYFNTQDNYGSDNSWLSSMGVGIRSVMNDQLLGAYIFGDRDSDGDGSQFWVVNPGLEFMRGHWDAHINGYFPTNDKKQLTNLNFGNQFGIYDFVRFQQHSEFDHLFGKYSVVGNGVDSEIGYSLPIRGNRGRVFLGSYYYIPPDVSKLCGMEGGLEIPLNQHISVRLSASHDNILGTQGRLGLRLELGGITQQADHNIQQRILDPVIRHEGTLGTASGIISQQKLLNSGHEALVSNNIWFFAPGTATINSVTAADCTYEHPCVGINTNITNSINNIQQGAWLYLAPGNYINSALGNGYNLNAGQSIFGRTQNYVQLAQGSQRALLNDTLFLNGNNLVTNLQVNGQSDSINAFGPNPSRAGVVINPTATGSIQINNSTITATTTDANHDAGGLLNLSLHAAVTLQNSTVTALTNGINSNSVGLFNAGNLLVSSSNLAATSTGTTNTGLLAAGAFNKGMLTITNSSVTGNTLNANTVAEGLFNDDFGRVYILNSALTANSPTFAEGIHNEDFAQINITNSLITANSPTLAEGIFNEDFGHINIYNSNIRANSFTHAVGIFNEDFGSINIANSTVIAESPTLANGIINQDFGTINIVNSIIIPNS